MKAYLDICREILNNGVKKENRTGVDSYVVPPTAFQHDMREGFPLLTTKKMAYNNVWSELEFFIEGETDKKWLQDRGTHIWDDWCNPEKVAYGHDADTQERMKAERDLGPIYGFQWRHFGAEYKGIEGTVDSEGNIINYDGEGVDQLANIVDTLKENPMDRRMIVSAWDPASLSKQALPPCHYGFQVSVIGDKLNLTWNQRSVDVPLGLPFNIAGYAILLHLLAKESGLKEGILTGFLVDVHAYENQIEGLEEQVLREPLALSRIDTENFTSIFDWVFEDTKLSGYESHPSIKFPIAV